MTRANLLRALSAAACAGMLAAASAVIPASAQQQQPKESPAASQFDKSTLQAFAQASLAVEAVRREWTPQIEKADTDEERKQMQAQAQQQMVAVVKKTGLDVQTYNQIYKVAQTDPKTAEAITQYRQQ